jgi:hypothetical protein
VAKLVRRDRRFDPGSFAERAHRAGERMSVDRRPLAGRGNQVESDPASTGSSPMPLLLAPPGGQPLDGALVEHDRSGRGCGPA